MRLARMQHMLRIRIKRDDNARDLSMVSFAYRGPKQLLVGDMHAIKHANRHHTPSG